MSFTANHMLFTWSGHFISSSNTVLDDFAGGLRFFGPGLAAANNENVMNALAQTFCNFWADSRSGIPGTAMVDNFKWNEIGTDGRYVATDFTHNTLGEFRASGTVSTVYPSQVACATTWTTSIQRGRASKGRTYWPTAFPVNAGSRLRLTTAMQQGLADWSAELIRALSASALTAGPYVPGGDFQNGNGGNGEPSGPVPSVMSNLGSGKTAVITGARVGDRLDIQRRRGDYSPETYVSASTAA